MPQGCAIFDVDRTLLDGMSGALFFSFADKKKLIPLRNKLRAFAHLMAYRSGLAPETALVEIGASAYHGIVVEPLREAARQCVAEVLRPRIYREAVATIAKHNDAGDLTILASGSNSIVIEALAEHVGAQIAIGTSAVVRDGRCTREVRYPLCYKQGKRDLIETVIAPFDIPLSRCHLYSDNDVDLPLFTVVGHRHAVNPDPNLAETARASEWEVLDWNTPTDPNYQVTGGSWPVKSRA